ncbi:unnamed protein product [Symbiodinium sp. CCMP2592]|nr:unnamed protein product [Symbiodinium sp. CCMP2592]
MAKLSPEYAFTLLKTMTDEEKNRFLKQLESDPLLPSSTTSSSSAEAPAVQPAAAHVEDPIGEVIAAEDYSLPSTGPTASPSPPAKDGNAPPSGTASAGTGGDGTAGGGGDGVANAKRWQREPEVKEPPPRPPSSPTSASTTPAPTGPPLKAKSLATPPKPASASGAPSAPAPSAPPAAKEKAPPPPLAETGSTEGSAGTTGQQTPASATATAAPQGNRAPLLASDAPATRLGHEGKPLHNGAKAMKSGGSTSPDGRINPLGGPGTGVAATGSINDAFASPPRLLLAVALNRPLLGLPNLIKGGPALGLWARSARLHRSQTYSSSASRLKKKANPRAAFMRSVHALNFLIRLFILGFPLGSSKIDGHAKMTEFTQLVADCNVPAAVSSLLSAFDVALFARSCTTSAELEELVNHFLAEASVTEAAERFITKASLRLLFCKCRTSEGMVSLEAAPISSAPLGEGTSAATPSPTASPPLSSSWQEAWPAKLSGERTAALRKRFEEDYPTELLDAESFPSARLRKQARFDLTELFLDEAPTRDIHEGPASFGFVTQYEAAASLRGPTTMEAQAADRRCWEIIADLVNVHHWKLDDALHEVAEVRSDMHSLLAPRPKPKFDPDNSWKARFTGNGRGGKGGGRGGKGRDGKGEKGERFERGGKGGKGKDNKQATPPGKWLSTLFMDSRRIQRQELQANLPQRVQAVEDLYQEKVLEDDRKRRTAAEHGGKSCKRTVPQREEAVEDLYQEKVLEDDRKKRTAAEHSGRSCRRTVSQRGEAVEGPCQEKVDDRRRGQPQGARKTATANHETHFSEQRDIAEEVTAVPLSVPAQPSGSAGATSALPKARAPVSCAASALSEGSLDFATCLELLAQYFSTPFTSSSHCPDNAIAASEAYFNLGAFAFDNGARSGIFQRTEQFSDVLRFLNALCSFNFLKLPGVPSASATTFAPACIQMLATRTAPQRRAKVSCGTLGMRRSHSAVNRFIVRCRYKETGNDQPISPPLKDTTCVELFLDICCGAAHPLTTALSSCGITCLPIDLLGEEQLDLLNDDTYDHLLRLCFSGIVRLAHGSPPCKEYSRLKLRPGAHVSLHQPTNAMSWLEPFVQDMLSEIQASLVNIPACSVSQDIAKSWLFACSYSEFRFLAGTCSHEGGHQSVAGARDEHGNFLSQRTAEYPSQLAKNFSEKAVNLFSSGRPSYPVAPCSLKFALASIPKKPRSATPTAAQDGGGIYSLPDWSLGPRYQSDSLHDLRKEWQSWLLGNRIPLRLQQHVEECLRHRLVSRKQLDKLLGLLQWILHGLPALRPWLCTLYDDMHRPLGTNVSISPCAWPGIHAYLDDKLRFTSSPPGTSISPGSTLLSARHKALKSKDDLALVPVSTKRMWLRVTDPTSSKRRLSESSRETLAFFAHLSSRDWRPRPLRPPPTSSVESAADAFGKGNDCGVGGWLLLPSGRLLWFAHRYTVNDFLDLGLPMQPDANLDISSYETLAQCFVLLAFWKAHGSGRLALTLPALSDNSGAESVCNKLYTSKVPLNLFVRKLSMWSSITGVTLDCSHIAGEKNDDADLLSRWDGLTELPDKFLASNRIELSLFEFWLIRFQVNLFPADTFLKWQLPSADSLGPTNRGSNKRK